MWVFVAEYAARIWLARRRLGYLVSFYGLLDAVTILPYFLIPVFGWEELRCLRLLRLLRLSKAVRYTEAMQRFGQALSQARGEAIVFLCATATVLYAASYGIWFFEHEAQPEVFATIFHALWWAVATLTTVGYGDVYPITTGGKIFTSVIAFLSLGVVASLAGLVASALTKVAPPPPRQMRWERRGQVGRMIARPPAAREVSAGEAGLPRPATPPAAAPSPPWPPWPPDRKSVV